MDNMQARFSQTILGIMLLFIGLSGFSSGAFGFIAMAMVVAGAAMLVRQYGGNGNTYTAQQNRAKPRRASSWNRYDVFLDEVEDAAYTPARRNTPTQTLQQDPKSGAYTHALTAARNAGLNPENSPVTPVDIGMMVLGDDGDAVIHRTTGIGDDVDYVQPFVQIRVPQKAYGRVKFEIVDSDGEFLFIHEDFHNLQMGLNLITPAARLPIHDAHHTRGTWKLRIHADSVLIAEHQFEWQEKPESTIRHQLSTDGEISNELRTMMSDNRLERLSLDDLLADQEENQAQNPAPRQQRSGR